MQPKPDLKPKIEPTTSHKPLSEDNLDVYLLGLVGDQDLPNYEFLTDIVELLSDSEELEEEAEGY
jgi:hypothetical protein